VILNKHILQHKTSTASTHNITVHLRNTTLQAFRRVFKLGSFQAFLA